MTTPTQEIRGIRARRRVALATQIIAREGEKVRLRTIDGEWSALIERRSALAGGKAILQVAGRFHIDGTDRRELWKLGCAYIAVAKSIPAA